MENEMVLSESLNVTWGRKGNMDLLESWFMELKARGLSEKTVERYKRALSLFTRYFGRDPRGVDPKKAREFRRFLMSRGYSPRTINTVISALSNFFDFLMEEGFVDGNPFKQKGLRVKIPRSLPRPLSNSEISKIMSCIKRMKTKVAFELMLYSGLRVSEVVKLRKRDFEFSNGLVRIYVRGKGRKDRVTFLWNSKAIENLKKVLEEVGDEDRVFNFKEGNLKEIARRVSSKCGVKFSCHTLRHTFATNLVEMGMPLEYVQKLLGHSNPSTTQVYAEIRLKKIEEFILSLSNKREERSGVSLARED